MKIYVIPVRVLLCLISTKSFAKQSVWEGSKEQLLQVKENGQKKAGAVKKWKDHITKWGLDTNYNHTLSIAARLNTNGCGVGLVYLFQKVAGKQSVWSLYFSEIKHEKETKLERTGIADNDLGKSKAYIFGKINSAYTLQLGYGGQQMIFPTISKAICP